MAITTRDRWYLDGFEPPHLLRRGDRNVPTRYLRGVQWKNIRGSEGYYVRDATPTGWRPVEFNFDSACWYEVVWDNDERVWTSNGRIPRSADITEDEVTARADWGTIDGQERTSTPNTPAQSEASELS